MPETNSTDKETIDTTASDTGGGVIDLLPPEGTVMTEMLRLGLQFDHADEQSQTWADYTNGVQATFDLGTTATQATLTDMDTRLGRNVPLDELKAATRIRTWRNREQAAQ